jgi:purine-cytosine permease-like protein
MRIGLVASSLLAAAVTTFVGGYAAAATGKTNPFVAVADLTGSRPLLVLMIVAIVVQGFAANIMNVYTAGLSLVNSVPLLGRLRATILVAVAAVTLSAFPSFVDHAQRWITHLGNVAAPLTGVLLADYLFVQRSRIDVPSLFAPDGRYRYVRGVNVSAVAAVAIGVGVYYALPQSWFKLVWGVAVSAVAYLALRALESVLVSGRARVSEVVAK